jgi:hypothetical protein
MARASRSSVMRGLDPRIHLFAKNDGLPGLAALRRPGNDGEGARR